jgi:hypothetical protein
MGIITDVILPHKTKTQGPKLDTEIIGYTAQ